MAARAGKRWRGPNGGTSQRSISATFSTRSTRAGNLGTSVLCFEEKVCMGRILATWRRQREAGEIDGLTPKKRGRKPIPRDERDQKIQSLEAEIAKMRVRAEKAELLVTLQKKSPRYWGSRCRTPKRTADRDGHICGQADRSARSMFSAGARPVNMLQERCPSTHRASAARRRWPQV